MNSFEKLLGRFFAATDRLQAKLSTQWRLHSNRRTIIVTIVVGAIAIASYIYVIQPPENFPSGQLVTVPSGDSLQSVGETLQEDGVVRNAFVLRVLVTILGRQRGVYAGDYIFKQPESIFSIARALSVGAYGLVPLRIRVPEGATMRQMALIFSGQLQRFNPDDFLAQTQSQEGYLFPDTYFFLPNATQNTVIQTMRANFNSQITSIQPQIASSTHSLSDIITMASIIEKEANNTKDRLMIAGVLWRRLALGLPLQSDPTLIYVTGKADSELTKADLQSDDPYNTYTQKGLPPTPIDSPSLDSIEAAAEATTSPYLYYLADKSGVTHYAKTYQVQLRNQKLYLGT